MADVLLSVGGVEHRISEDEALYLAAELNRRADRSDRAREAAQKLGPPATEDPGGGERSVSLEEDDRVELVRVLAETDRAGQLTDGLRSLAAALRGA